METEVKAHTHGLVKSILIHEGSKVAAGDELILLT